MPRQGLSNLRDRGGSQLLPHQRLQSGVAGIQAGPLSDWTCSGHSKAEVEAEENLTAIVAFQHYVMTFL